jgi:hypothetical protein
MQANNVRCRSNANARKEKVEVTLARLRSLKSQVSELRAQCEALKNQQSEIRGLTCSECGKLIEKGQEVTLRDSFGHVKSYYHKDCFKAIWRSDVYI